MPINEEQTAHRQHPVPQNIMSVEFKLVGDLTVRQFMYLVIGGITVYLAFISKINFLWKWGLIFFGGFGSLALAFVPFGDRGLDQWIKNFIKSVTMPTQRVWRKTQGISEYFLADYAESLKREVVALAPARSRRAITDYFEGPKPPPDFLRDTKEEAFLKRINFDVEVPPHLKSSVTTIAPPKTAVSLEEGLPKKEIQKPLEIQKRFEGMETAVGRTLKHIPLEGEIVLPKRTRPIKAILAPKIDLEDSSKHTQAVLKQVEELRKVLRRAEEKFSPEGAVLPAHELILGDTKDTQAKENELREIVEVLKKENKNLSGEIDSLKKQMQGLDKTKETYKTQVSSYAQKIKDLEGRKNLVEETIQTKVVDAPKPSQGVLENAEMVKKLSEVVVKEQRESVVKEKKEEAGTSPNVIWGTVKDKQGHLLENATLIIRDDNDIPIRALKTNQLGQFIGATPLSNGSYKIEVLNNENSFAIMDITLEGKPLKALEFLAINK